tara:strand:- start:209 stop:829 length:621 start_codon:yes stop_codon:yes gene_type:complete
LAKVCIIDYGIGNIASIHNGILSTGNDVVVSSDPKKISNSSHLILPGVGSFQKGMEGILSRGLAEILNEQVINKKKPILGICLGMQLFASHSFEDGHHKGLNWINGKVEKIDKDLKNIKVPHMGWNEVKSQNKSKLLTNIEEPLIFYFVHSYHFIPNDTSIITGTCKHGKDLTACIEYKNIYAAQFHPEKSHDVGQKLLNNFFNNT